MLKQPSPAPHKTTRTEITSLFGQSKLVLDETAKAISPFGGLASFIAFLGQIGLPEQVQRHLPFPEPTSYCPRTRGCPAGEHVQGATAAETGLSRTCWAELACERSEALAHQLGRLAQPEPATRARIPPGRGEGAQGTARQEARIHRRPTPPACSESAEALAGSTTALCLDCQPKDPDGVAPSLDRAQVRRPLPPFSWWAEYPPGDIR